MDRGARTNVSGPETLDCSLYSRRISIKDKEWYMSSACDCINKLICKAAR